MIRSMIALYLLAVVIANLVVAHYGQPALPFTAFLLVPLDLVTRDVLHHEWKHDRLWPKMTALIAAGSLLALRWHRFWHSRWRERPTPGSIT